MPTKQSRVPTDPVNQIPLALPDPSVSSLEKAHITMRTPFPDHQVKTMCRSTKKDNPKAYCSVCKHVHGMPAIQLDYVGHAAITDRLLDVDPAWVWEPLSVGPEGYPVIDKNGGMWIRLTVNGVTRLGYGDASNKEGGDAMKERIGDAIRNAAMRFGAALDLWHKGELHSPDETGEVPVKGSEVEERPMTPQALSTSAPSETPATPSTTPTDDIPAEPGEVAFMTTKLKLLKTDQPEVIVQAAGLASVTWDPQGKTLVGPLSKAGFAALRVALKGKK